MEVNNLDQPQRENLSSGNDQIEQSQSEDKNEVFSADKLKTQIDKFNSKAVEYKNLLKKKAKIDKLLKTQAQLTSKLKKVDDELSKLLSEN